MFNHYINFKSLPLIGRIPISEPEGFDKASYKVKQEDGRFGRDLIKANEDTELTFTRGFFENLDTPQILEDGGVINNASHAFDYMVDIFENDGWEGELEHIIEKDGIDFSTGIFDYVTAKVETDKITIRIIQNTSRETIKRLMDTDVDAFSNTSLDDRTIAPCQTTSILLKAKPIVQNSLWEMNGDAVFNGLQGDRFNPFGSLTNSAVENSFTPFSNRENGTFQDAINNFRYIKAKTNLSNGSIEVNIEAILRYRSGGSSSTTGRFILNAYRYMHPWSPGDPVEIITVYQKVFSGSTNQDFAVNETISLDLPNLIAGESFALFWADQFVSSVPLLDMGATFTKYSFGVQYTSTSIDTVAPAVRLIDLTKHNVSAMVDIPVVAPQYDSGGEHYDNFAFSGLLLGGITDKPFYTRFKDLITFTKETCSDYQLNPGSVEILPFEEYYANVKMAEFTQNPEYDASRVTNKRFTIKTATFAYKKSSDGRETNGENTIDDVHTETQKFFSSKVDGDLKVDVDPIRSAFLLENARRRYFDVDKTKSLENDSDLFLVKCVRLAPGTAGGFTLSLAMQITETGNLKILNNDENGDGLNFNWTILGLAVGNAFYIDAGENVGTWNIVSITETLLELSPVSVASTYSGEAYITTRWYYTNVLYTNATDEGYAEILGVDNPKDYSNLDYSWGRNIKRWYPYLASAVKFKPGGVIKTASFKNNGNLQTRKTGEASLLADSADITNSDIAPLKILNPFLHSVKVYADFETVTQLISDIQNVKGYVEVTLPEGRKIKGHVKESDYTWLTEDLNMDLEERFEGDFMEINDTTFPSEITISAPQYETKNGLTSFSVFNYYVSLFDGDDVQMYPPIRFTKVKINGVAYSDVISFSDALQTLIDGIS